MSKMHGITNCAKYFIATVVAAAAPPLTSIAQPADVGRFLGGAGAEPVRPPLTEGEPSPGKFVRQLSPEFRGSGIYHGLYLPANWQLLETDSPIRREMSEWIADVLKRRPGTWTVRGRVVDRSGRGIPSVRVQCGHWHWSLTDAEGRYAIPSLVSGRRPLIATKAGWRFASYPGELTIESKEVTAEPMTGEPSGTPDAGVPSCRPCETVPVKRPCTCKSITRIAINLKYREP